MGDKIFKIIVGLAILSIIIIIKHLFLPQGNYSFIVSVLFAIIIGLWIIL